MVRDPIRARASEARFTGTVRELNEERAASLGRAGRRLEKALGKLAGLSRDAIDSERDEALDEAGEALYFYIVQREALGLTDHSEVYTAYGVPGEVRVRMGVRRTPKSGGVPSRPGSGPPR